MKINKFEYLETTQSNRKMIEIGCDQASSGEKLKFWRQELMIGFFFKIQL